MKKRLMLIAVIVLFAAPAFALDKAGEVAFVTGPVFIQRGDARIPASLRGPVMEGDAISTGRGGAARILMVDDSVLTLSEDSRLAIDRYAYDPNKKRAQSVFKLLLGRLRAAIGRANATVATETAVAGVRGTVFDIWYDAVARITRLAVFEGEVEFRNIRLEIKGVRIIRAGQRSSVSLNEPPSPPQPIPPPKPGEGTPGGGTGDVPPLEPPGGAGPMLPGGLQLYLTPPIDQQPKTDTTRVNVNVVFP